MVKKYLYDVSPLAITVGNFAFLLIPALGILIYNGFDFQTIHPISNGLGFTDNIHPLVYVGILGIVGTGIANIYFYQNTAMSQSGRLNYGDEALLLNYISSINPNRMKQLNICLTDFAGILNYKNTADCSDPASNVCVM